MIRTIVTKKSASQVSFFDIPHIMTDAQDDSLSLIATIIRDDIDAYPIGTQLVARVDEAGHFTLDWYKAEANHSITESDPAKGFDADSIEVARWIGLLVPRTDFDQVFTPMIWDRGQEIIDLGDEGRTRLAKFRRIQLRIDLATLFLLHVSTTLFKRIKTIWTLS